MKHLFTLILITHLFYIAGAQCPTCGNGVADVGETNLNCAKDVPHPATATSPCAQPGSFETTPGVRFSYDFVGTTTFGFNALPSGWEFGSAPSATTAGTLAAAGTDAYGAKAGTVQPNCSGSCTSTNGFCIGNFASMSAVGSGGFGGKLGANFDGRPNVAQNLSYAVLRGQGSPTIVSPGYNMSTVEGFKIQCWLMPSETSCGQSNSWGSCTGNNAYLDFSSNGGTTWTQVLTINLSSVNSDMCTNSSTNTKWLTEGAWSRLCVTVFKSSTSPGNFYTAASATTAASGIMVSSTYFTNNFRFRIRYSQSTNCTSGISATNPGRYLGVDYPVVTTGNEMIPCGISFANMAGYGTDNNDDEVGSSTLTSTATAFSTVKRGVNQAERGVELFASQTNSFTAQNLSGSNIPSNFDLCNAEGGDKQCIDWRTNSNLSFAVYECITDWEASSGTGVYVQYYKGGSAQSVGMSKVTASGKTASIGWRYSASRIIGTGASTDLNPGCNGYSFLSGSLPSQFARGFYALAHNSTGQSWSYYGASSCSNYFNGPTVSPIASIAPVSGASNYVTCSGGNPVFTAATQFASDFAGFSGTASFTVTGPGGFSETITSGGTGSTPITTPGTYLLTPNLPASPTQCLDCARTTCVTITTADLTAPTWYLDADNDGWYVSTQSSCTSPGAGWTSVLPAGGSDDCDDNDNTKWQLLTGYVDADGDGYTIGGLLNNICSGATLPSGYSASSLGADCNDNNAAVNPGASEVCGNGVDEDCNGSDLACGSSVGVTINITGSHIICKDEFLTITATPTYINCPTTGLQWYEDGSPIPGATSTTLTLNRWSVGRFYVAATCGATTVFSDTLKSNLVVVTADSNRLCPLTGLELRVDPIPGVTYQWAEGSLTGNIIPGANTNTYTTSYIGNVWCRMIKPTCSNYGKFRTFLSKHCGGPAAKWAGSEDEVESAEESVLTVNDFGLYPNPATNEVTIETSYLNGADAVRIYDYNGRLVLEQTGLEGNLHTLDISMLNRAMYIVEVRTAGETARKKLIVE